MDIRWQQRFNNFEKAYALLIKSKSVNLNNLSDLEKEGIIQRFEYTFELAWKTLKDYLEYVGINLDQISPRSVVKEAFKAKIILNGDIWIEMLESRNLMAHTYDKNNFEKAMDKIINRYIDEMSLIFNFLKDRFNA